MKLPTTINSLCVFVGLLIILFNACDKPTDITPTPTPIDIPEFYDSISAGLAHSLALTSDNLLWVWGSNEDGQSSDTSIYLNRFPIPTHKMYTFLSAGGITILSNVWTISLYPHSHSLALKSDRSLWAWGNNNRGQIGNGLVQLGVDVVPTNVGHDFIVIAAGGLHSLGIKSDGSLWAWGANDMGQLGDGTYTTKTIPTKIDSGYIAIAAGAHHSIGLKADNTLWTWGLNHAGQLGDGTNENRNKPIHIGNDYKAITAGSFHSHAIRNDGTLMAFGSNSMFELGDGTNVNKNTPVIIGANFMEVDAGGAGINYPSLEDGMIGAHTLAIKTDGTLWSWGFNQFGQVGDGTFENKNLPVQIGTNFSVISAGGNHSLALKNDGTLWAWGRNNVGQLGDSTLINKNIPIQIGAD